MDASEPGTWLIAIALLGLAGGALAHACIEALSGEQFRRPVVAAGVCILWLLLAWFHGPGLYAVAMMILVTALVILSLVDLRCYLLPDVLTLPGIAIGVAATWLPGWPVSLSDSALSAALGYLLMMTLATAAERYYGREAIGQGDWKMVAMLGAFLGSTKLITTLIIANATGAVVGLLLVAALGDRGRRKLPLGTFLGAAAILMAFV